MKTDNITSNAATALPLDRFPGGRGKVDRYNWNKDVGAPPEMAWVKKHLLRVDPTYQRQAFDKKCQAIASGFRWTAFGSLSVCRRPSGELYIFDGQHRWLAAMRRDDIAQVPCAVYQLGGDVKTEAEAFLAANRLRRMLTGFEGFNAEIQAENQDAIFVAGLIAEMGRQPKKGSSGNCVACVTLLKKLAAKNRDRARGVALLVHRISRDHALPEMLVSGLYYLDEQCEGGILGTKWEAVAEQVGHARLTDGARRVASVYRHGHAKTWGMGIAEELNHGRRRRLVIDSVKANAV